MPEAERVGKYMIRPVLSLERLSFSEKEGKVCYRYGKEAEEVERMDYLEFIARVISHIPDKGDFLFRISHRMYPAVRSGYESFWGLDGPAVALLSFGYGITDRLGITLARSGRFQDVEISSSWLVLQQGENASLPFSASVNGGISWITEKQADRGLFNSRNFKIDAQFVLSHQFSRRISVLVMPAYSSNVNHWEADPEGTFALELGGRFMVVEHLSLVAEWVPVLAGYKDVSRDPSPAPGRPVFPRYFRLNLTVTVKSAFTAFPSRISGS